MNKADLIKYLEKVPDETLIWIVVGEDCGYGGTCTSWEELTDERLELSDMRGNQFAKGKPWENDVDLYMGEV